MDLDAVPWRKTRHDGVAVHFYAADRATGRALVLIRMEPGCGYPRHRHRGEEHLLVLQGAYADERGTWCAGQLVVYPDGSEHSPVATREPANEPCVLLALAHEGIALLA
jgi:anti-sigma factor ChrR (cupin superfamily)